MYIIYEDSTWVAQSAICGNMQMQWQTCHHCLYVLHWPLSKVRSLTFQIFTSLEEEGVGYIVNCQSLHYSPRKK
jgi:hypothetical protein